MDININISSGELFDKISILEIKSEKITDENKLNNVLKELHLLKAVKENLIKEEADRNDLYKEIKVINEKLWHIEDQLRIFEKAQSFTKKFIELARAVYLINDERYSIKSKINEYYGSKLQEEKQYVDYSK